jgi:hypothetical protein
MSLVYEYSYGDEDVLGSLIKVIKLDHNSYKIKFKQTTLDSDLFRDITSTYKIITKDSTKSMGEEGLYIETITMIVETYLNPPPQKVFKIIY